MLKALRYQYQFDMAFLLSNEVRVYFLYKYTVNILHMKVRYHLLTN